VANRRKVRAERLKDRRDERPRGLFKFSFPWVGGHVEGEWPATSRSSTLSIFAVCMTLAVTATICVWLIFVESSAENIASFGDLIGGRKPEKRQTPSGEVIEVCPPCPDCEDMGCMDFCPVPPPCNCQSSVSVVPPKLAPSVVPPSTD
jgi:hypothetical protein